MQGTDNYTPETSHVSRVLQLFCIYNYTTCNVLSHAKCCCFVVVVVMYPASGNIQVSMIRTAGFTKAIRNFVEAICEDKWRVWHVPSSAVF